MVVYEVRAGDVADRVADDLICESVFQFVQGNVALEAVVLILDEYRAYRWVLIKRVFCGTGHAYSCKCEDLFVVEACWNNSMHRNRNHLGSILRRCLHE